jgi:tetratricopeptide (TPR) repeat protein
MWNNKFITCCSLIFLVCSLHAQCDPVGIFNFASSLENEKEFYRAITEYKRVLFYSKDDLLSRESQYRIARCYLSGNKPDSAVSFIRDIFDSPVPDSWQRSFKYLLSESYYNTKAYDVSLKLLVELSLLNLNPSERSEVSYSQLWCQLQHRDLSQALQIAQSDDLNSDTQRNWENIRVLLDDMNHTSQKKPWLAGALSSVLPGAGQCYAGRWQDGFMSFLINGLFLGGMISAFESGHKETAIVLTFFETGWYSANIYNAVNDAHKTNRDAWDYQLKILEFRFGLPFKSRLFSSKS